MDAAEYVCDARERLRLSKAALGRAIGASAKSVARWEAGAVLPRPKYLTAIAQLLLLAQGRGPVALWDAERALSGLRLDTGRRAAVRAKQAQRAQRIFDEIARLAELQRSGRV